jgi:3-hydroxyisobutyrate dehydrogenase
MAHCFGIVGHGVVGALFSRLLHEHGALVVSYDRLLDCPETAPLMQKTIEDDGSNACSLAEVIDRSDYILSVVTPQSCFEIVDRASRSLDGHKIFVDFNSTSPAVKRTIGASITSSGGQFVEGVILGAVNSSTSPVILLGGPAGESATKVFRQYGLAARFYSAEIGRASAFKMLRSIFSKGMEAVLIETLVAAHRAGLMNEIWEEIQTTLGAGKVQDTFQTWIRSHARSAQRRCYEMREVVGFLEEIGLPAVLPRASGQVFARSVELKVTEAFPREPEFFSEVIEYLERETGVRSQSQKSELLE